jgi:sugar phosphate isomerase/epimerase
MATGLTTRRDVLAAMAGGIAAAGLSRAAAETPEADTKLKICVFSKHFHWTDWQETAAMAAELGFDGVDLTVREAGHVLPAKVEQDLPKAVEIIRKAGLAVPMITAGIVDTSSPHAEAILRTASGLGIRYYRWGGLRYTYDRALAGQLEELKPKVNALAQMNEKYKICAMYHTHSGLGQVGAPIWDLWYLIKDLDPRYTGVNYDVGHATVEGGFSGWIDSLNLVEKHLRGIALKDFKWGKNAKGDWAPQWCAPGEGMVNFPRFFQMIKAAKFSGPVQMHYEYPGLGGADSGRDKLTIPKEQLASILRRDLQFIKAQMRKAQLL